VERGHLSFGYHGKLEDHAKNLGGPEKGKIGQGHDREGLNRNWFVRHLSTQSKNPFKCQRKGLAGKKTGENKSLPECCSLGGIKGDHHNHPLKRMSDNEDFERKGAERMSNESLPLGSWGR